MEIPVFAIKASFFVVGEVLSLSLTCNNLSIIVMSDPKDLPYLQGQAELLLIFENQLSAPLKTYRKGIQRLVAPIDEHLPALVVAVNSGDGAAISNAATEFTKRVQVRYPIPCFRLGLTSCF